MLLLLLSRCAGKRACNPLWTLFSLCCTPMSEEHKNSAPDRVRRRTLATRRLCSDHQFDRANHRHRIDSERVGSGVQGATSRLCSCRMSRHVMNGSIAARKIVLIASGRAMHDYLHADVVSGHVLETEFGSELKRRSGCTGLERPSRRATYGSRCSL